MKHKLFTLNQLSFALLGKCSVLMAGDIAVSLSAQCTCVLRYGAGTDWDQNTRRFLRNQSFSMFNNLLEFRETSTDAIGYEATLHPVEGGNTQTTPIDEHAF